MIAGIFQLKDRIKNNRLVSNFFYLSLVQLVSLLVPLIVTPYLVSVLGLSLFGLVAFSQAIMLFLLTIVDFGFNISATQKVSVNRHLPVQLNHIFSRVIAARVALLLLAFAVLLVLFFFPKFNQHILFYLASFSIVAGQAFLPIWMYQGLEQMKLYALLTVAGRVVYMLLLFLFVKGPADFILVNLFLGLSFLLSSLATILHLFLSAGIRFIVPKLRDVVFELRNGFHLFITSISINVYTYSNSTILGLFAGYEAVGLYSIAEKVLLLLKQVLVVFSQVLYPAGCKAATESGERYRRLLKNAYVPFICLFVALCAFTFLNTSFIVQYFYHQPSEQLELLMRLFILAVLITALNIPAYQTLLSFNFQRSYSYTLTACCLLSVVFNLVLSSRFGIWGTTANVLLTELLVTFSLYAILHQRHRPYSLLNRSAYV